jgi:hypothetical protein
VRQSRRASPRPRRCGADDVINKANFIAIFEHPRLGERMRVSTFVLRQPISYNIIGAREMFYEAETQIWRGEDGAESIVDIIRHAYAARALPAHESIVRRSLATPIDRGQPTDEEVERAAKAMWAAGPTTARPTWRAFPSASGSSLSTKRGLPSLPPTHPTTPMPDSD